MSESFKDLLGGDASRTKFRSRKLHRGRAALAAGSLLLASLGVVGAVTGATASASGAPLKVMAIGQWSATSFSYPEGSTAMQAAIDYYNSKGGLDGHKIALTICNDEATPSVASTCARQAVSSHDVAVLGSYSEEAATIVPILKAAHIAYIGATAQSPQDFTSGISFPLEGLNQVVFAGVGYGATLVGCKEAGILIENYGTTTPLAEQSIELGAGLGGGSVVQIENTGTDVPSYAPAIADIESAGATCIDTIMPPDQIPLILQEMAASADPTIQMVNAQDTFSTAALEQLGSAANGMILSSSTYPATSSLAAVKTVVKEIGKYEPAGTAVSQFSIQGWAAVDLLKDGLTAVKGSITSTKLLTAMGHLKNASTQGLYAPYTDTSAGPVAGAPRLFLTKVLILKVSNNGATETPISKGFVNVVKK
jgi:ABC-type branched-subunit amino acid transport system substrate-binding protein